MAGVETISELGERIREARLSHGLSQGDLAGRIGLDRSALVRVEGGERKVTALELFRLGEALDLPISHFVHLSPVAITSRRGTLEDDPQLAERLRFRLDAYLEAHLRDAEALRSGGYVQAQAEVPSATVDSEESAKDLARRAREYIGMPEGPLPALADVAELFGLFLLVADLDVEGSSLTPEPGFGVSVIGGRTAPGRRRFTAAHEIGHHLLGDEYQSDAGVAASRDERERHVDAFAGEFLLPAADVRQRWDALEGGDWERLVRLAALYRVSWAAVVRVASSAEVLAAGAADRLHARTPQLGDFIALLGAGPAEDLPPQTTGRAWRQAVVRAYVDAKITQSRAVEMLHGVLSASDLPPVPEPDQ
jgi:Zn-dependent peptidase ImmA (M78 family)/transcriptional regulator with XRE-family HTH domain